MKKEKNLIRGQSRASPVWRHRFELILAEVWQLYCYPSSIYFSLNWYWLTQPNAYYYFFNCQGKLTKWCSCPNVICTLHYSRAIKHQSVSSLLVSSPNFFLCPCCRWCWWLSPKLQKWENFYFLAVVLFCARPFVHVYCRRYGHKRDPPDWISLRFDLTVGGGEGRRGAGAGGGEIVVHTDVHLCLNNFRCYTVLFTH